MSLSEPDAFDDELADAAELADPWSLDDLDRSADLGSVRSAWAGSSEFADA